MILVDTSVFIDFFNGKNSKLSEILIKSIETSEDICTCGLIMTEILQGIRLDKEYDRIRNILSGLLYLPITKNIFIHASSIYRTIRKHGGAPPTGVGGPKNYLRLREPKDTCATSRSRRPPTKSGAFCVVGKTIRSPIDCIIAAICIEHEIELLHNDKDFNNIAQYTSLRVIN